MLVWLIWMPLLMAAVYADIRVRRIPNPLVLLALVAALVLSLSGHGAAAADTVAGWRGAWASAMGLGVGLLCFLPLYALHVCGAGDVKWMAACGAFLGAQLAWQAALLSWMLGGVLAVIWMLWKQLPLWVLWPPVQVWWTRVNARLATEPETATPLQRAAARLPFSLPIAMACVLVSIGSR